MLVKTFALLLLGSLLVWATEGEDYDYKGREDVDGTVDHDSSSMDPLNTNNITEELMEKCKNQHLRADIHSVEDLTDLCRYRCIGKRSNFNHNKINGEHCTVKNGTGVCVNARCRPTTDDVVTTCHEFLYAGDIIYGYRPRENSCSIFCGNYGRRAQRYPLSTSVSCTTRGEPGYCLNFTCRPV